MKKERLHGDDGDGGDDDNYCLPLNDRDIDFILCVCVLTS